MKIYKRIALIGAIANPNVGDEAILESNLQKLYKLFGNNCKIYIFTKDSTYTALYSSYTDVIVPIDYLHRITQNCSYDIGKMKTEFSRLMNFSDSETNENFLFKVLHEIFKEIDILHVIGGGYLNSLWPDMLYEVFIATQLATLYQKKYILTGISTYPLREEHQPIFQKICENAEFIDFRDDSFKEISPNILRYSKTLDDAVFLEDFYPQTDDRKYATILFHNWKGYSNVTIDKLQKVVIPFMEDVINNNFLQHFYILGFSKQDLDLWKEISFSDHLKEYITFKNLTANNCIAAKHLITNAAFNIGSRFHLAVFSLSGNVPVLSISYDRYYENKLKSIHMLFESDEILSIESLSKDTLFSFINNLTQIKQQLLANNVNARKVAAQKEALICNAYGINKVDSKILIEKLNNNIQPKISVIIPIYNMDAYLRNCLDSVLNQSLQDIEIICINDGSTDYTQMILNEYSWKDKRIKIISQRNHGVAYARNIGIESATGEFLYFLDPDDWLPDSEVFSDMYRAAKEHHVLICGGNFREYAARGIIEKWDGNLSKYTFDKPRKIKYSDYQFDYGWVRFIYNREFILYNHLRIPALTFFEDPVFFVQAMHQAQEFFALNRCTYCYRTGHKTAELSYEKVVDLMTGLYTNITFAKRNGYNDLLALELDRIENDYSEIIVKYLLEKNNNKLRKLFTDLNTLIYEDSNRIEYRMYNKIIQNKLAIIWAKDHYIKQEYTDQISKLEKELRETKEAFYNSTTWKLGNMLLFIPKKLKTCLTGGRKNG